jgi:hypothetical protein
MENNVKEVDFWRDTNGRQMEMLKYPQRSHSDDLLTVLLRKSCLGSPYPWKRTVIRAWKGGGAETKETRSSSSGRGHVWTYMQA